MPHPIPQHPTTRALARLCVLLLTAALMAGGLATSRANAAALGTVSGTVTGPDGGGVGGVRVSIKRPDDLSAPDEYLRFTEDDGRYSLQVPAGRWAVTFDDDGGDLAGTVRRADVTAGRTVVVDASLRRGVVARGTVAFADAWTGVDPGPQASVRLDAVDADVYPRESGEVPVATDGTYRVTGLTPGRYRATFDGVPYHSQCYGGGRPAYDYASCLDPASVVTVGQDGAVLDPVVMRYRWAQVTGIVRGPDGAPLPGARALDLAGEDLDGYDLLSTPRSDGRYAFFVQDRQKVRFAPPAADDARLVTVDRTFTSPGPNRTTTADVVLRSRTALTASARGGTRTATVAARVAPRYARATPGGTVRVRYKKTNGKAGVRTVKVPRSGQVSVRLPKARKGTRTITVVYGGSSQMVGASTTVRVRVR